MHVAVTLLSHTYSEIMRNKARFLLAGLLLSTQGMLHAGSGTEGAAFLNIPVGAAPAAMGSAYSALASDVYAPVWNPAGLGRLTVPQLGGEHVSYLESIRYEHASVVYPFKNRKHGIGASIQYLTTGDIPGTDNGGNAIGDYSSYYAAYALSYGASLRDDVAIGVTGKAVRAKISDVSAGAYAGDIGVLYQPADHWLLAGTLTNVGSKLKFISQGDSLPMAGHLGAAYQVNSHWMISSEGVYRKSGLASFHAGTEWRPLEMVLLRGGYRTDTIKELSPAAGITGGIGVRFWGAEFAYAFLPFDDLGSSHYFSLTYKFGNEEESRKNLILYDDIKRHRSSYATTDPASPRRPGVAAPDDVPDIQQLMELLEKGDGMPVVKNSNSGFELRSPEAEALSPIIDSDAINEDSASEDLKHYSPDAVINPGAIQ